MPLAPVTARLHPATRAQLVAVVQVLVAVELPGALHQAEATRVLHAERADRQATRVVQRAPEPLAVAGVDRQPLGVVQLRAEIQRIAGLVRPEQVHAGQRCDAQLAHRLAQVHPGLHVQRTVLARRQHHAVGAGGTRRVEQRVDDQVAPVGLRPFHPELAEAGKLLTHRQRRVDRQPACGQAIPLALANDAEIARTEQSHHLVLLVLLVQRIEHLETGEAQALQRSGIDLDAVELEHGRVIADLADVRCGDLVDAYRRVEVHALMVELQVERCIGILPVGMFGVEAQPLVIGKGHSAKLFRQVARRFLIAAGRQFLRLLGHIIQAERQRTAGHQHVQPTCQPRQHARRMGTRLPLKNA